MRDFVEKHSKHFVRVGTNKGLSFFRGVAIEAVCDFEIGISDLLKAEFRQRAENYSEEKCENKIFGMNGIMSGLGKMSLVAHYLGYLSEEDLHDLKKFYRIRNIYAHGRDRGHIRDEPDIFKLITDCYAFKKYKSEFDVIEEGFYEEGTFKAIRDFYLDKMQTMIVDPCEANQA